MLRHLDSLVRKSLVVAEPGEETYRLLETIRQYGEERMDPGEIVEAIDKGSLTNLGGGQAVQFVSAPTNVNKTAIVSADPSVGPATMTWSRPSASTTCAPS